MKTLDEVSGPWHRKLDSTNGDASGCDSDRFRCVMDGEAVLDRETGLVWQRMQFQGFNDHLGAEAQCLIMTTGGRSGWRLPTAPELFTLRDASQPDYLAAGHPFVGVATGIYWSSNTYESWNGAGFDEFAWTVAYEAGPQAQAHAVLTPLDRYWCVRGPSSDPGPGH